MTIIDKLIETLEALEIGNVYEQGSLSGDYPRKFFTFWNRDSFGSMYYDNIEEAVIWEFEVNFYTSIRSEIETDFETMIDALKEAGFVISGRGYSVGSDEKSHTGRGISARFIETEV